MIVYSEIFFKMKVFMNFIQSQTFIAKYKVFLLIIQHIYHCNITLNIVWIMWSCGINYVDGCCVLTDQPPDLTTLYSSLHNEHSHALSRYFIALLKKCITNCLPSVSLVICVCVCMCVMDVMIVVTYNIYRDIKFHSMIWSILLYIMT